MTHESVKIQNQDSDPHEYVPMGGPGSTGPGHALGDDRYRVSAQYSGGLVGPLRTNVEGLKLSAGVLKKLTVKGDRSSLRYALQLLTLACILASLAGRSQIEVEDVGEMNELFLDAKTSAANIAAAGYKL
ncbi:hypothetical protein DFP72DRAFT_845653 [Ephemerocybe angulata]|uniref:RuvB-like helicase n=1 Tax=Ephemerocybe angulata TaxID=980116 RepID=A0A8H6M7H8_9AGAR|nr:hypothetical protein DFP72DRAFT_845653 [Tulosesus angulatus]